MGEVWRATHRATGRPVAIKAIRAERVGDATFLAAFERELRVVAGFDHPGVVEVVASGASAGPPLEGPWFAMELGRGNLAELRPTTFDGVRAALDALLGALGHAHARGVLHRDVKPHNVIDCGLHRAPRWKLGDFGLASLPGRRVTGGGTPGFLAPEQIGGGREGPWTDLYAVGAVAWALLCGEPPSHRAFAPLVPAPRALVAWFDRMLASDPNDRWDRAADARAALRGVSALDALADGQIEPGDQPTLVPALDGSTWTEDLVEEDVAPPPPPRPSSEPPQRPEVPDWRAADPPDLSFAVADRMLAVGDGPLLALRPVPLVGRDDVRDASWALLRRAADKHREIHALLHGPEGVGRARLARWIAEVADELGVADPDGDRGRPSLRVAFDVDRDPAAARSVLALPPSPTGRLVVVTAGPGAQWAPSGAEVVPIALGALDARDWAVLRRLLGLSGALAERLGRETLRRPGLGVRLLLAAVRDGAVTLDRGVLTQRAPLPALPGEADALQAALDADPAAEDRLGVALAVPWVSDAVIAEASRALGVAPPDRSTLDLAAARAALAAGRASGRDAVWCEAIAAALPADAPARLRALALDGTDRDEEALAALCDATHLRTDRLDPWYTLPERIVARLDAIGAGACDPRRARAMVQVDGPPERALDNALALIRRAGACGWGPEAICHGELEAGHWQRELGRLSEVLPHAERALALAAGRYLERALSLLIPTLCNLGRAAEAVPLVARYAAVARDPAFTTYFQAFVARAVGDVAGWHAALDRLAPLLPDLEDAQLACGSWIDLGERERAAGRLDEAARCYRAAIRRDPEHVQVGVALANLTLVEVERGDWAAAEAVLLGARWTATRRGHPFVAAAFAQLEARLAVHRGDLAAFDLAWDELEDRLESGIVDAEFAAVADPIAAALDASGARARADRVRALAARQRSVRG